MTVLRVLTLTGSCLLVVIWHGARVFDLGRKDYGEAPLLAVVERWRTEPVSPRYWERPPYSLTCYGPGYYWLVKMVSGLTPWDHTLIPGRLISLGAMFCTTFLVGWMVYRRSRSWEVSQTCALLLLTAPVVTYWIPYHRVDSLAVCLAVASYAALDGPRQRWALSALLLVAGSLVKQSVVFSGLPAVLFLWCRMQYRTAAAYVLLIAGAGALAWLLVAWASSGYLLQGAILSNLNPMSWKSLAHHASRFFTSPLITAVLLLLGVMFVRQPRSLTSSLSSLALLTSGLIHLILSAKAGSDLNYYLEATALAVLVLGQHGLAQLWFWHARRTQVLLTGLALALAVPVAVDLNGRQNQPPASPQPPVPGCWSHREVLADGLFVDALLAAGKQPLVNDPYMFRLLVENGTVPVTPVVNALASGQVGDLVLSSPVEEYLLQTAIRPTGGPMWPREVVLAMQQHFVLVESRPGLLRYRYRGD
jgi:hypothetical protein